MYCSKCGTQMDDDAVFCPACGTKNGEASEGARSVGGLSVSFEKGNLLAVIIGIIAGIILIITTSRTWCEYSMSSSALGINSSMQATMSEIAESLDGGAGISAFSAYSIILIIAGIAMIACSVINYVKKQNIVTIAKIIIAVIAAIIVILAVTNGDLNDFLKTSEDFAAELGSLIGGYDNVHFGKGAGPVFGIIGIIASAASAVIDFKS